MMSSRISTACTVQCTHVCVYARTLVNTTLGERKHAHAHMPTRTNMEGSKLGLRFEERAQMHLHTKTCLCLCRGQ